MGELCFLCVFLNLHMFYRYIYLLTDFILLLQKWVWGVMGAGMNLFGETSPDFVDLSLRGVLLVFLTCRDM